VKVRGRDGIATGVGGLLLQTNRQFLREYRLRTPNTTGLTGHQEAPYGYDSVWTVALMLNNSIQRMIDQGLFIPVLSITTINLIRRCFLPIIATSPQPFDRF